MEKIKIKFLEIRDYIKRKIDDLNQTKVMKFLQKFFSKGDRKFGLHLYLIAIAVFIVSLLTNELVIVLSGDFYLQQIPFYFNGYDDWWTFFKTGEFPMWDESGFLGVNNIGANTFYYLWNIFFLPILLVPRALIPQGLAFLIITKFVLAGYVMKLLLRYIGVSEKSSTLVSMAYAFSGWALYYLWFNHFLEITILLPLVLLGLEKLLNEKKTLLLIVSLFLSAITNYFFFIMICFTSVIYAVYRFFQYAKKYTIKESFAVMGLGLLSYVIAMFMALVVLIPCFTVALESSRVDMENTTTFTGKLIEALKAVKTAFEAKDYTLGFDNLKKVFEICTKFDESNNYKMYTYPIISFFYPPSSCYDSILYNNNYYDNANSSLFIYTPLMLMLVPSIITSIKEKRISHIVAFVGSLIMIFTPFVYYCFSGFTTVCYGRWELFIVVISCMYIATNFDKLKSMKKWYIDVSAAICLLWQVQMLYVGYHYQGQMGTYNLDGTQYYAMAMIAYLVVLYHIFRKNMSSNNFIKKVNILTIIEIIVVGNVCVICQGVQDMSSLYGGYKDVSTETKMIKNLSKEDLGYYRLYNSSSDRDANNLAMMENYRGLGTFHSLYNFELQDFIDWSRISYGWRGWSMGMHEKRADLDTFTNIKYYLLDNTDINVPFGYDKVLEKDNKVLYENTNFVEFGFAFDTIIPDSNMYSSDTFDNSYRDSSYRARTVLNETNYTRYAILDEEIAEDFAKENELNYKSIVSNSDYEKIVKNVYINKNDIVIDRAIWDVAEQGKMDGYDEPVNYTKEYATGLKWASKITADLSSYAVAPQAKERGGAYVTVKVHMGDNVIVRLYGTNENGEEYLLTEDTHMFHNYSSTYDAKYERGFYVNDRVTKLQLELRDTLGSSDFIYKPDITYQYYDTFKNNIDKLKENPIKNLEIGVNDYKFETDFDSKKIVALTIPFDPGWHLYKIVDGTKIEQEIVKVQGGFIGFVAENSHVFYELRYQTPGLKEGLYGLSIGLFMLGVLYVGFELGYQDKKNIKKQLAL